jgi:hypothetical protein
VLAKYRACTCIIVLEEIYSVDIDISNGLFHEEFIFVGEMTQTEAIELLAQHKQWFGELELKYIFDTIGTSPSILLRLAKEVPDFMSLNDFINGEIASAKLDINKYPDKVLLMMLQMKEYSERHGIFISHPSDGNRPLVVNNSTVVYRVEEGGYTFSSTAHQTAIKSYKLF